MTVLADRWAAGHLRALSETQDQTVQLAIVLGACRSIVRVVDRTVPPLDVDWAAVVEGDDGLKGMSYTDFGKGHIRLNPVPVLSRDPEALDICAGFGLHEASHSQESRDRYKFLVKRVPHPNGKSDWEVPAFSPIRVAAYLWNLVEDVRIEEATSRRWPGFRPYFRKLLDWIWRELQRDPEVVWDDQDVIPETLAGRLRIAFLTCRLPDRTPSTWTGDLAVERDWWKAWQHDYLTDAVDTPTTIQRALDHLAESEPVAKEMAEQAAAEKKEREAGERLRAQIERLIREGVTGAYGVCVSEDGEVTPLTADAAAEVRQLAKEGLVEVRPVIPEGAGLVPVRVRKPTETADSRRAYIGRPDAEVEALRAALVFRPSVPRHDEKLLRSGVIDDEELWRWGAGDNRVFSQHVVEAKPEVLVGILVDISGSMYGGKLRTAQRLAQVATWAVHDQEGMTTKVWAHTGDLDSDSAAEVYRIWEPGDPLSRLGLINELEHGDNYDHLAIAYCVSQMEYEPQPQKVLILLSDGLPAGNGSGGQSYGGAPARRMVRSVTRWALSRGVQVCQIAIDHDLRPREQAEMYGDGNWIPFTTTADLAKQLAAMLARYL